MINNNDIILKICIIITHILINLFYDLLLLLLDYFILLIYSVLYFLFYYFVDYFTSFSHSPLPFLVNVTWHRKSEVNSGYLMLWRIVRNHFLLIETWTDWSILRFCTESFRIQVRCKEFDSLFPPRLLSSHGTPRL